MKIQTFLIWIQDTLFNRPDISIKTIRLFVDSFERHLSNTEQDNIQIQLLFRVIREIGLKQLSIKAMNNRMINEQLENELNNLKGKNDKPK